MIASLAMFGWAIAVGSLIAVTLSLYGVHMATRDSSLQSMTISQATQLGVLLALGFTHSENAVLPWLGGLVLALLISLVSEKVASKTRAAKNTVFVVFFLVLLAGSYCLISAFPLLDSHHSQAFFGDLVYLGGMELFFAAIISSIALSVLVFHHKAWCNRSFLLATFGGDSLVQSRHDRLFFLTSLLLIVTSVFSVGLLLTLSALFIPTLVLSFVRSTHLRKHFVLCAVVSGLAVVLGFFVTLQLEDYPTVPIVVLFLLFLSLVVGVFSKIVKTT